jgi:hypothetical protein
MVGARSIGSAGSKEINLPSITGRRSVYVNVTGNPMGGS